MKKWISKHLYSIPILYFICYIPVFLILEHYVVPKYIIHCALDDWIPFHEIFVIPYLLWFLLVPVTLLIYMLKDKKHYLKLCALMFGGMTCCLLIYMIFPNGLNLRLEIPRDNIFCQLVAALYQADTSTNVCPSIHVSSTIAIQIVHIRSGLLNGHPAAKAASWIMTVSICLSTLFLKQHSIIDVILGILLSVILAFFLMKSDVELEVY